MIHLHELKNELTEYFVEIVDIINKLMELRGSSFESMLEINSYLEKSAKSFTDDTAVLIAKISEDLNKKIVSIDIKSMKDEITEASETFLKITDDLELLSYNTICTTISLGAKGATIAHISKEIKKNATVAKNLLENISQTFTSIYDDFKEINATFSENSSKVELMIGGAEDKEAPLEVSSDISRLIECSQFHDIIIQEIDAISSALIECTDDDAFCLGKSYGVHELAIVKMDEVQTKTTEIFEEIKEVIKEFLYHINTDIQNIVGRANLVKMEFEKAKEYSDSIETIVGGLISMIKLTEKELKNAENGILTLRKFGKSFRNLVVITAVEVARIGDTSLESVVVSMSETERILMSLVDKLSVSLKLWGELKNGFSIVLRDANININRLRELHSDSHIDNLLKKSGELDGELAHFRGKFSGDEFMEHLSGGLMKINRSFAEIDRIFQNSFETFKRKIPQHMYSDPDFEAGRASASIIDVMAHEDDHSSIDFF
ncbi:hypothetical protein EP073_10170 [Geovibrio thiophilus]|uniref:Methyl-accepting transducer domain-containing protein n=1 Tax=Geovibrio thiophilus TaxID=139438 RepID=A0A410JZZ3_9BACT|nr:hypothetical protein [Geovibrio thiophilus]QAR33756.1 hypothetical protein EP073_10170 [Geovibrio thiophilus]